MTGNPNYTRIAKKFTDFTGKPTSGAWYLKKTGSPSDNDLIIRIRYTSNDTIIAESSTINSSTITIPNWYDFTFTTPIYITDTEIYFSIEYNAGDISNRIDIGGTNTGETTYYYRGYDGSYSWGSSGTPVMYYFNYSLSLDDGYNCSGLSVGTLYHYRAKATNSNGTGYGSDVTLLTKPNPPTSLTISSTTSSTISLSWNKGTGANNTIIQRKTGTYPTTYTDGTNIYNGTSTSTIDNTVSPGIVYYYSAWSYTNWDGLTQYSDDYNSSYGLTCPEAPTNAGIGSYNATTITLVWDKGTGANNTIIIKKTTGYPNDITDGTTIYNGTGTSTIQTYTLGETVYYRAWSYAYWTNPSSNKYSLNGTNFTAGAGSLYINCYDETALDNLTFDISISNSDGSEVYNNWGCTNPHYINASLCPQGSVSIFISSNNYSSRSYYLTISPGIFYLLNTYLPPINTTLFVIQVVDDYNQPVSDALVTIKRYTNISGIYDTVTSLYTDGYGEIEVYLIDGVSYKVFIEKTGFDDFTADYIPDVNVRTKIFKISFTTEPNPSYDYYHTNISFGNVMTGPGYMQLGNITTTYLDKNSSTVDTDIYIYEYYAGSYTLLNSYHNTSNSFTIVTGNINTTRSHKAVLYFNNTADFIDVVSPLTVFIDSLYIYTNDTGFTKFDLDERINPIVGPFTINGNIIPWSSVIAFCLGMAVLLLLGPFYVGASLIGCGLMMGFVNGLFSMYLTNEFPVLLVTLCPIFIILGVLYIMSKGGREHI
jgi:hypothetical protein